MTTPAQVTDLLNNPDFHRDFRNLSPDEQRKFLSKSIPEYNGLPETEKTNFLTRVNEKGQQLTLPAAPNPIATDTGPDYRDPYQALQHGMTDVSTVGSHIGNEAKDLYNSATQIPAHPIQSAVQGIKDVAKQFSVNPGKMFVTAANQAMNPSLRPGEKILGTASALAGGNPDQARQEYAQGNVGEGDWDMWLGPATKMAAAEGAAQGLAWLRGPINRTEINSLGKMIQPGIQGATRPELINGIPTGHTVPLSPDDAAVEYQPLLKQAAKETGILNKGGTFKGDFPTLNSPLDRSNLGKVREASRNALTLANRAVDISARPLEEVMKTTGKLPVPPQVMSSIRAELKARAAQYAAEGANDSAAAVNAQLKSLDNVKTYDDLNKRKENANKVVEGIFGSESKPSKQQSVTVEPIWTYRQLGKTIRDNMYPALQQDAHTNFDLGEMGRREALAMDARDGIFANYTNSMGEQADEASRHYLEGMFHGSLYKTHLIRKGFTELGSPAGVFNKYFKRGLGQIPSDLTPETVTSTVTPGAITPASTTFPKQPLQLPAQAGPTTTVNPFTGTATTPNPFVMPPEALPQAQAVASPVVGLPQQNPHYIGAQQPPTSTFKFDIPTDFGGPEVEPRKTVYKGAQVQPKIVSGPKKKVKFQAPPEPAQGQANAVTNIPEGYMVPSRTHGLTSTAEPVWETIPGNIGVLRTTDVEAANNALSKMREFKKSPEFKKQSATQQARLSNQIKTLQNQIAQHTAGQALKGPPAGAIHTPATQAPPHIQVTRTPGNPGTPYSRKVGKLRRTLTYGSIIPPPPPDTSKGTNADEQREEQEFTPDTHTFSKSAWQQANPGQDVNAAAQSAEDQGYEVVD